MNKSKVAIVKCESYDETKVYEAVKKGVDLLGGIEQFVKSGEKILLKPNILMGDKPEKNTTTNPVVFKSVAKLFKQITNELTYGDSPGFGKPLAQARKSQLEPVAQELGVSFADFDNGVEVNFKDSPFVKHFVIAKGVDEADGIISLSKMKTHGLTRITGAVKNQFGCIPGLLKAEYHVKMPNSLDFSKMLVTLNMLLRPRLYIMDSILAMEGNGPRGGDTTKMNVLIFSKDPIALDTVFCKLIDLNPEFVPTNTAGKELGLGTYLDNEIEIVGEELETIVNKKFNVVRKPVKPVTDTGVVSFFKNLLAPRPVINKDKCVKCGVCVRVCPVKEKAVNWDNGDKSKPPVHNYKICIRCYCCQEMCPESAISVKTPLLGKLLHH